MWEWCFLPRFIFSQNVPDPKPHNPIPGQAGLCLVSVNFRQRTQNEFSPATLVQSLESDIGKASTRSAGLALILLCIVYPAPDDRMSIKREVGLQKNRFAKIEFVFFAPDSEKGWYA